MNIGQPICRELNYTFDYYGSGECWESFYTTEVTDDNGVVIQLIPDKRNFSADQKALFLAKLESVAGVQMIAANEARVLAETNLAAEKTAHVATSESLNAALTAERAAHAETQAALVAAQAEIARLNAEIVV